MLGEQIYEAKGQITGSRVLDAEQFKMEYSYMIEGRLRGIEVMETGTYWSIPRAGEVVYGEDKAIVMTKDGNSMCSLSPRGIGRFTGPGKVAFRGAALCGEARCNEIKPDGTGELSFLSNMVIVFEAEVDQTTRTLMVKGWEWR
jgi:hypothetical protein